MSNSSTPPRSDPSGDQPMEWTHQVSHDDSLDEEEKLLAGRHDVNMPALLTRDVKGG